MIQDLKQLNKKTYIYQWITQAITVINDFWIRFSDYISLHGKKEYIKVLQIEFPHITVQLMH